MWDIDHNNYLDSNEIIKGIQSTLGIYLSNEEVFLLAKHLDKDGDGQISSSEFQTKINLTDYHKLSHRYTISESRFIDSVLSEWYIINGEEKVRLAKLIMEMDADKD